MTIIILAVHHSPQIRLGGVGLRWLYRQNCKHINEFFKDKLLTLLLLATILEINPPRRVKRTVIVFVSGMTRQTQARKPLTNGVLN